MKEILRKQWQHFLESNKNALKAGWKSLEEFLEGISLEITGKILERHVRFLKKCRKMQESNGKSLVEFCIL